MNDPKTSDNFWKYFVRLAWMILCWWVVYVLWESLKKKKEEPKDNKNPHKKVNSSDYYWRS